jgi:ABC-type transport system involved in resistance to organic solvents, periplasmic component
MKFKVRHADEIVGAFVVVAALALAGGIIAVGANQRWFAKDVSFTARFQSAAGASPGTALMMRGFQIGKVASARLDEDNEVVARIVVYSEYYPKVRTNSILELATSPIGLGSQLLFHPGKGESLLPPGSPLPLADSAEGKDLIERGLVDIPKKDDTITRLLAGVNPLIENLNKTVVSVNRSLGELELALAGRSSGPLGSIVGDASKAVKRVDGTITDVSARANELLDKANELVANVDAISKNLEQTSEALRDPTGLVPKLLGAKGSVPKILDDDNELFDKISSSVSSLERTVANLQAVSSSIGAQMPSVALAIDEGRTAIKQAQDVLTGLKNNPLLRGGIPQRSELEARSESLRAGDFQ